MGLSEINQRTIQVLRSALISSKDGLTTREVCRAYSEFFQKELGSPREVENWLNQQNDLCKRHPQKDLWLAVQNEDTAHVQKLVGKQKPVKRKQLPAPRAPIKESERRTTRSTAASFDDFGSSYRNERTIMTRSQNNFGRSKVNQSSFSRSIKINQKVNEKYEDYNDLPNSNWEANSMQSYSDDPGVSDQELDAFGPKRSVSVRDSFDEAPKGVSGAVSRTPGGFGRGQGGKLIEKSNLGSRIRAQSSSSLESDSDAPSVNNMVNRINRNQSPLSPVLRKRRDQYKQQMLNSERSASLAGSRPNSSVTNRQKSEATRYHVKKLLVDAVEDAGGEILLEKLLEIFNTEFIIKRLGKSPVPMAKLSEIIERIKENDLVVDGDKLKLRCKQKQAAAKCIDQSTQTDDDLFQGTTSDEKFNALLERIEKLENTFLLKQSKMEDRLFKLAEGLLEVFPANMSGCHINNNIPETTISKV